MYYKYRDLTLVIREAITVRPRVREAKRKQQVELTVDSMKYVL